MPTINKTSKRRPWEGPQRKAFERSTDKANRDVYDSPAWRTTRKIVREDEPLCRYCLEKGLAVDTEEIDHILPINQGGNAYERDNLQGLCTPCHRAKSRDESKQGRGRRFNPSLIP